MLDESQPDPARRWRQLPSRSPEGTRGTAAPWVQALAVGPDGRLWAGTRGGLAVIEPDRPEGGWQSFRAHPLGRWVGLLRPALWEGHIISDDVTSLVFIAVNVILLSPLRAPHPLPLSPEGERGATTSRMRGEAPAPTPPRPRDEASSSQRGRSLTAEETE